MPCFRDLDVHRLVAGLGPLHGRPSAARERVRRQALDLIVDEGLVEAAYSYRLVPLDAPAAPRLQAGGETLYGPKLLPESGELTALGCCVCTIGPRLEARVTELFGQKRASLAVALDGLGNELVFVVSRHAQDRMLADCRAQGLTMAGELRSGDPGLDIGTQAAVLRLATAESIGVSTADGHLMRPLKSTSAVLGVGRDLPAVAWSRCDACPSKARCRVPAQAAA